MCAPFDPVSHTFLSCATSSHSKMVNKFGIFPLGQTDHCVGVHHHRQERHVQPVFQRRGLPYMTSAKCWDFFTQCHVQKSADFVPSVCFFGDPLLVRTSYIGSPPNVTAITTKNGPCSCETDIPFSIYSSNFLSSADNSPPPLASCLVPGRFRLPRIVN